MKGTLHLLDDGWELRQDGSVPMSGEYPLYEDDDFIETAAEKLNNWQFATKPYSVIDERDTE